VSLELLKERNTAVRKLEEAFSSLKDNSLLEYILITLTDTIKQMTDSLKIAIAGATGYIGLELIKILYPICRSITGDGVRKTLKILQKEIPLDINEIPTKTKCFDWKIPKEWNVKEAYILTPDGKKICN
jgi:hypothetical protein